MDFPSLNEIKLEDLTPKKILQALDKYIIGQYKAKRAVAIALRNRFRRQQVSLELQKEIMPKNIILIGATGVGKTEIARRLAALSGAPFIKVEATKFTETGYVGREVDSIIRDLMNLAVNTEKEKSKAVNLVKAKALVEEELLNYLLPNPTGRQDKEEDHNKTASAAVSEVEMGSFERTKEKLRKKLAKGELESKSIDIDLQRPTNNISDLNLDFSLKNTSNISMDGIENFNDTLKNLGGLFSKLSGPQRMKATISEARKVLLSQILEKLIDMKKVAQAALAQTEMLGIVFLDEVDKIISKNSPQGMDVSREGVQRDLLPLVEGAVVNTKYGMVKTDHILFIAAGAFHMSSPSDLIPEFQGRFPIRVQLSSLSAQDMEHILTKPRNALVKQYQALLKTDRIHLEFEKSAISEIAKLASEVNTKTQNIGARRLATVMEKLLEDFLFEVPVLEKKVVITKAMVVSKLSKLSEDQDLSRYIL